MDQYLHQQGHLSAVASPVEIGILRGHLITETKKGQRREIVLDAAESAAQRGEICRRCRCHWKTVLPDDNLIAHERRRGRCRPASFAAAVAAADKAANAPDNILLVDARYSPR